MMPTSHRNTELVGVGHQIVGVNRSQLETDQTGPLSLRPKDSDPWQSRKLFISNSAEVMVRILDGGPANFFQVTQGSGKPNCPGNMRCPGLETVRS